MKAQKSTAASNVIPAVKIKKKTDGKKIATHISTVIGVSLVLSILIRILSLDSIKTAGDVFNAAVWVQIAALTAVIVAILVAFLSYAYSVHRDDFSVKHKLLPVISTALVLTFVLALIFGKLVSIYAAPLTLCSLLVAALIDKRVGIVANVLITQAFYLTYAFAFGEAAILDAATALVTSLVASIFLIVFINKSNSRLKFTMIGLVVAIVTAFIPMLVNVVVNASDTERILTSGLWSFVAVLLSVGLFMIVLPGMEFIFRLDTGFHLAELCSLENPLLKRLAKEAPGTFNHSMVVGNLSELCADAIGENSQLAKVCSYYHDVGKMKNPEYFVENQRGYNPHDDVIPEVSVAMIVSHVSEGYDMLRKERLPDIVADVAIQHHGTTSVNYFLYKAQNFTEEDLDSSEFSYPGPKPQSKIAAIVMIADTVEAASRAVQGLSTPESYRAFVHKLIKQKSDANQFDECDITFSDLDKIEETLALALPSIYHGRIEYKKKGEK